MSAQRGILSARCEKKKKKKGSCSPGSLGSGNEIPEDQNNLDFFAQLALLILRGQWG
jgi:hypothetical protein